MTRESRCYCPCGASFSFAECVDGRVPEHAAWSSPFDPPGYKPGRCVDSGRVPFYVGVIA